MSKTVEIHVNREKYVQMLMAIIRMPVDAFLEPSLREFAEEEILRLIGEQ
tara:strand:- start:113 stop:262 length:150 start_codon:yes stop_codon:yes gene_type:complete